MYAPDAPHPAPLPPSTRGVSRAWWRDMAGSVALGLGIALILLWGASHLVTLPGRFEPPPAWVPAAGQTPVESIRYGDHLYLVSSHAVVGGRIDQVGLTQEAAALWELATEILPEHAPPITQLDLVTDGRGGTTALVTRASGSRDAFVLALDPAESRHESTRAVVHEYAHMLTLTRDAVSAADGICDGSLLDIWCLSSGSAVAEWAERFWVEGGADGRDRFVSRYAATDPWEDLAETFTVLSVDGRPDDMSDELAAKFDFIAGHSVLGAEVCAVRARLELAGSRPGADGPLRC